MHRSTRQHKDTGNIWTGLPAPCSMFQGICLSLLSGPRPTHPPQLSRDFGRTSPVAPTFGFRRCSCTSEGSEGWQGLRVIFTWQDTATLLASAQRRHVCTLLHQAMRPLSVGCEWCRKILYLPTLYKRSASNGTIAHWLPKHGPRADIHRYLLVLFHAHHDCLLSFSTPHPPPCFYLDPNLLISQHLQQESAWFGSGSNWPGPHTTQEHSRRNATLSSV
ncbi:hypothetical protein BT67DRAFT_230490 [Trichocladium antarcticum]|uniref:Uncharacterized protein n=1 Tax=Trichocladium antarcticum TaxID=1450529 RepID=A0AAN6ZFY1_9PEZI|nr:hypothetical protein BT67DRAFT_230490 [Trichocladium antarcticum]